MAPDVDVLIVGGGMVGASLALALAPLPLRIRMVEAVPPGGDTQPSYDERSTAVAYGSRVIFDAMGVWRDMEQEATPIEAIHVSDRGRPGFTRMRARDHRVPALGYVVPNRVIGAALWAQLEKRDNVTLTTPARVLDGAIEDTGASVTVQSGDETTSLGTGLLVAADGARSALRDHFGIEARLKDYRQTAVITNLTPARTHGNVAYERFTDTGPLALLPLGGDRCSVVWTIDREQTEAVLGMEDEHFLAALQEQFGYRLGEFVTVGERFAYPLYLVEAEQQTRPRLVVLGNAAHGIHPVAGQGFNLSLRDVAALAEALAGAQGGEGDQGDCGDRQVLANYESWRLDDQRRVIALTDGLVRLFTSPLWPVRTARNLGLAALDLLPGAKRLFARQTMGRTGRLPRLARGMPLI